MQNKHTRTPTADQTKNTLTKHPDMSDLNRDPSNQVITIQLQIGHHFYAVAFFHRLPNTDILIRQPTFLIGPSMSSEAVNEKVKRRCYWKRGELPRTGRISGAVLIVESYGKSHLK